MNMHAIHSLIDDHPEALTSGAVYCERSGMSEPKVFGRTRVINKRAVFEFQQVLRT